TLGADVGRLREPVSAKGFLHAKVPVLGVRQTQIRREREQGHRLRKGKIEGIRAVERVGKIGEADLWRLQVRRRADGRLQGAALARVIRVVENAVRGAHR